MPSLETFIISDEDGFQALANDWNRLASLTNADSVFFRHEWSDASWQWLKQEGCELCIVCVRRDGNLIGLCPLVRRRITLAGIRMRKLSSLAVPDNQEFSLLADPQDVECVAAALFSALRNGTVQWDLLDFEKLPCELPSTKALLNAASESRYAIQETLRHANPGIDLRGGWDAYYGRRSRRLKKGNNLVRNRLERDGKVVEIQCIDSSNDDLDLQSLLRVLEDISARSWKSVTGLTLDNPGPGAFLARLSELASRNAWLLVWLLLIDQKPVAMEYQLEFNSVVSGLRADFDDEYSDSSPGTLLNWRIIEQLFGRDASYYALGPGSNAYKARWVEESRELVDVVIYGNSLRANAVRTLQLYVKPFVKRILGKNGASSREDD